MKDKSLGKNVFWIYSTNKFVWIGGAICSIFSAFMISFLCVANLSENKVLLIFLLPISLSILLIYWALPSKILLGEDSNRRARFVQEKKHSSQTDRTIFVSYRKEVYIALEKHLKEKK